VIPSIQWHLFYRVFSDFAAMAGQYHFYEPEVARMEASLFEMSPYPKHHKNEGGKAK